jgi:hypothetical protein
MTGLAGSLAVRGKASPLSAAAGCLAGIAGKIPSAAPIGLAGPAVQFDLVGGGSAGAAVAGAVLAGATVAGAVLAGAASGDDKSARLVNVGHGPLSGSADRTDPAALPALPGPAALPALPGPAALPALPGPAALPALPGPAALPALPGPAALPALPGPEWLFAITVGAAAGVGC